MKLKSLALICTLAALNGALPTHAQDATPPARQRDGGRGFGYRGMQSLPADEQAKLKAAMETASKDPKVVAAQEKVRAAAKESREALDAAILAADPSLEPILKKLQAAQAAREQSGERGARGTAPATGDAPKPAQ